MEVENQDELETLQYTNDMLSSKIIMQMHLLQQLENEDMDIEDEKNDLMQEIQKFMEKNEKIDDQINSKEQQYRQQFEEEIEEYNVYRKEKEQVTEIYDIQKQLFEEQEHKFNQKQEVLSSIQQENQNIMQQINNQSQQITQNLENLENYKREAKEIKENLGFQDSDELQTLNDCKRLNNQLQEMKGNIRVYCRVKGFVDEQDKEDYKNEVKLAKVSNNDSLLTLYTPEDSLKSHNNQHFYDFNFEYVFDREQSQEQVFEQLKQLVQSSVDGYNVCVFAYGQTGSGKTYTMNGDSSCREKMGITYRAIEHIFEQINLLSKFNWVYKVSVSFTEIYNDTVRCLLTNEKDKIKETEVETIEEIMELINQSNQNRIVKETSMNEHSSRSHCIFQLKLVGEYFSKNSPKTKQKTEKQQQQNTASKQTKQEPNIPYSHKNKNPFLQSQIQNMSKSTSSDNEPTSTVTGTLNLIDLAGSERLSMSKAVGETAKETQAINKSLSNLADVIQALVQKQNHIPYRNCKLTHHLQNYLGGNSKTLMLVNISPKEQDFKQTLCSLRFAEKVKSCQTGKVVHKQKQGNILTPSKQLMNSRMTPSKQFNNRVHKK